MSIHKLVNVLVRSSKNLIFFNSIKYAQFVTVVLFFYYYYSFVRSIRAFALLMGWKYALLFQHTWLWFTVCDNSIIIIIIIINLVLISGSSSSISCIWFGYWYRLTMELSLNGWLLPATKCKKVNLLRSNFNIQSQSSVSLLLLLLLLFLTVLIQQRHIHTHAKLEIIMESVFSV